MGIVDLHFHDSEFTAVKRPGEATEGESGESGAPDESSGRCPVCKVLPLLLAVAGLAAVAFLAKRKLGGSAEGGEEATLSEFGEEESEDVDVA